ncbi:dual specificity phosphatase 12 [Dissophora globulifera]|uniref:Dual specificity phosphatase 12 n=1 Tax=Dissophora globulifera TaxID=979702 RepID=A0A9P6RRI6_9FUNG|nr:dual specificity phosphatase 12 [Dissophora globulifera]
MAFTSNNGFPEHPIFDVHTIREMQEIVPGLYLSGAQAAGALDYLKAFEITHVLQVTDIKMPPFPGEFVYKIIPVPDMDETNLIKHFPDTNKFIQEALDKGGRVLVHCQAGASRSVTIMCAYLMKTKGMTSSEALLFVQAKRPIAGPNDGFMDQLQLYGDIEFDVSTQRTEYRRFLIASMAAQREMFGYIDEMTLAADPTVIQGSGSASSSSSIPSPAATTGRPLPPLKCKKCRRALVSRESVVSHMPGEGQNAFQYRKRDGTLHISQAIQSDANAASSGNIVNTHSNNACQSYFVEPVEWIQGLHALEGKVSCPKCDSKLGTFNWSGEQCSCGTWVTPAFMLHKGKVDG